MIRIAFLFSTLEGFGLVKIMFYLAKYLNRNKNFEVYVITLSLEPSNSFKDKFINENIPIYTIGMSRLKGLIYSQKALISLLNEHKINILHSNGFRANLIHSQIKKRIPHIKEVMTIHLDPNDDAKHPLGYFFKIWRTHKHISIIKKCNNAYACSKSISDALKKYDISIPYIQNGIDLELLNIEPDLFVSPIKPDTLTFIVMSGLHKRKNIEVIIQAFNKLDSCYQLLILGDGPDKKRLEELAKVEHIHFLGYQSDIIQHLQNADVFISASYSEGLPLSVMESMYFKLIPILSKISPHQEIIENSSFEKYIFECTDVIALIHHCHKIKDVADSCSLKNEAKQIISDRFSAERMTDQYIDLYKNLMLND